jgi:antitoxin component YwqK of YwqJK toxin-antitoxin module
MMRVDFDEVDWDESALLIHDGAPFTGEVVEKTADGAIVAVTSYVNGREDGPSTEWYPSGQVKARGEVRFGTAVGTHQVWHPNGQLAAETEFDDQGNRLSNREWDAAGNVIAESTYPR